MGKYTHTLTIHPLWWIICTMGHRSGRLAVKTSAKLTWSNALHPSCEWCHTVGWFVVIFLEGSRDQWQLQSFLVFAWCTVDLNVWASLLLQTLCSVVLRQLSVMLNHPLFYLLLFFYHFSYLGCLVVTSLTSFQPVFNFCFTGKRETPCPPSGSSSAQHSVWPMSAWPRWRSLLILWGESLQRAFRPPPSCKSFCRPITSLIPTSERHRR